MDERLGGMAGPCPALMHPEGCGCAETEFQCDICGETEERAVAVCQECAECLCEIHALAHRKAKRTGFHTLLSPDKSPEVKRADRPATYCAIHPSNTLGLYCATCSLAVCQECALYTHTEHSCVDISRVVADERIQVMALQRDMAHSKGQIRALAGEVEVRIQDLIVAAARARCQIQEHFRRLSESVKLRKEELEEEVGHVERTRLSALRSQAESLQGILGSTENRDGRDATQLLQLKTLLLQRQEEVHEVLQSPSPCAGKLIRFVETNRDLESLISSCGRIVVDNANTPRAGTLARSLSAPAEARVIRTPSHHLSPSPLSASPTNLLRTIGSTGSGDGQLYQPYGVAVDSEDNIIVADYGNNRIQVFSCDGTFIRKFGAQGSGDGQFVCPVGVTVDSDDNILVADFSNHRIQVFSAQGAFLRKFGKNGSERGEFSGPVGIAVDNNNNIVVSDMNNERIQMFYPDGSFLRQFGSKGSAVGQLAHAHGVAVDSSNNILVADYNNHRIQVFTNDGTLLRKFGSQGSAGGQFARPTAVAVDCENNIIVADYDNHRIQVMTSIGTFLSKFGCQGASTGQMHYPIGVAVDSRNNIVVADYNNNRIQVFRQDTHTTTKA